MRRIAKLIDADVVLKDIEDLRMSPWYNANYLSEQRHLGMKEGLDMAEACVRYATEAEAIPVIRCKDCTKFVVEEDQAYCLDMFGQCDENGFCAWAKRRQK